MIENNMETQNFFQTISPHLQGLGCLRMTLAAKGEQITVSVLPIAEGAADTNASTLSPLRFTGTCEELDKEFFRGIRNPIVQSKELFSNVRDYEAQVKIAKEKAEADRKSKLESGKKKDPEPSKEDKAGLQIKANDVKAREVLTKIDSELKDKTHFQLKAIDDFLKDKLEVSDAVKKELEARRVSIVEVLTSPSLFSEPKQSELILQ